MPTGFIKRAVRIIAIVSVITSCGNSKPTSENKEVTPTPEAATPVSAVKRIELKPGVLVSKINYPGDPTLSFAIYTPANSSSGKKMPVLVLFDPHGDGTYPLNLYKSLADKYGYILVGSNDSKNGNEKEVTAHIIEQTISSIYSLLPIDSQRIYVGGFSGGGRVAAMMALGPNAIQGLVTCGAGFPASMWTAAPPTIVIGMAGNKDPNLSEVVNFIPADNRLTGRYQLIRTDSKHECRH